MQGRGLVAGEETGRAKAFREEKHEIWEIRSEKQQLLEWLVQASICWNSWGKGLQPDQGESSAGPRWPGKRAVLESGCFSVCLRQHKVVG